MFFSVNKPLKIQGRHYLPCICYTATRELEATINDLESKGLITIHKRKVLFCNGVVMEDPRRSKIRINSRPKEVKKEVPVKEEPIKTDAEKTEGF